MRSLNAHLHDAETHDRLAFHPSCPICRQTRLIGTLSTGGGVVSPRTQALIAAGMLAVSASTPPALFAAEPDHHHEGTAPITPDPATNTDVDPGGEPTKLPDTDQPASAPDPANDAAAAAASGPATDPPDPVVDTGDTADRPGGAQAVTTDPAATTPGPGSSAPAVPVSSTAPPPQTPPVERDSPASAVSEASPASAATVPRGSADSAQDRRMVHAPRPQPRAISRVTPADTVAGTTTPPGYAAQAARGSGAIKSDHASPGDRTHTVLSGECLWSIAADVLGASATPAAVAREVHRLWERNRDRIGTGDPDLILPGTTIALR